jgi:hypothetical protein
MSELNASIRNIPVPGRMQHRPISSKGFPVPWFVAQINGEWDFRVIGPGKIAEAHNHRKCWLCGGQMGRWSVFTIGPMCSVNRVSAEPPAHLSCAEYAAKACPFLTQPRMRRNDKGLEETGAVQAAGIMISRNPGVTLLWITKSYRLVQAGDGVLFRLGPAARVFWYAEGRTATRAEVDASIASGLPLLEAEAVKDGPEGIAALQKAVMESQALLPGA